MSKENIENENSSKPVFIRIFRDDLELGSATGFQINYCQGYLVTNWHVVSGVNPITSECSAIPNKLIVRYKRYFDFDNYTWLEKIIDLYNAEGEKIWYEHPAFGAKVDVVVIPLNEDSNYVHYKDKFDIHCEYELNVTENVFVLGFPLGYTIKSKEEPHAVWTSGTIASDPSLGLNIDKVDLPVFLIDSKTRQGQSGSPVIYYNEAGWDNHFNGGIAMWGSPFMKEIGVYSGRIHKDSDLGYVWKWEVIRDIVNSIKR
jgi:hypothetical protein